MMKLKDEIVTSPKKIVNSNSCKFFATFNADRVYIPQYTIIKLLIRFWFILVLLIITSSFDLLIKCLQMRISTYS